MARARAETVAASPRDMLSKRSRCPRNVALGVTPSLRASPSALGVAEQSLTAHSVPSSAGRLRHSAAGCAPSGLPCRAGAATAGVPTLSTLNAGPSTPRRPLRCPPPQAGGRGSGFGSGGGATSHSQGRIATEVRTPEGPIHWGCYLSRRSTLEVGLRGWLGWSGGRLLWGVCLWLGRRRQWRVPVAVTGRWGQDRPGTSRAQVANRA